MTLIRETNRQLLAGMIRTMGLATTLKLIGDLCWVIAYEHEEFKEYPEEVRLTKAWRVNADLIHEAARGVRE